MFSVLGFLVLVTSTYGLGREATKVEIEYMCKTYHEASLATESIICGKGRELDWIKEVKKKR